VTSLTYDVALDPPSETVQAIECGLHAFNLAHLGEDVIYDYHTLAVVARSAEGEVVGGIHGELCWDWLYIKSAWVSESHRGKGIGTGLLSRIEQTALRRGFSRAHLETTDFQALGFYLKHGYEMFGRLPGKPADHTWYYLKKDLSIRVADKSHDADDGHNRVPPPV
jgi:GNAT superfamily N-acetyltransferase